MEPTEDVRTVARLLIRGHFAEQRRLMDEIDARGEWNGYGEFLAAIFYLAVQRRFPRGFDRPEVITLVAEVRARWDATGEEIDPRGAEVLVGAALGVGDASIVDGTMVGRVESLFIYHLLGDPHLGEDELERLLDRAAELAASAE